MSAYATFLDSASPPTSATRPSFNPVSNPIHARSRCNSTSGSGFDFNRHRFSSSNPISILRDAVNDRFFLATGTLLGPVGRALLMVSYIYMKAITLKIIL